MAINDIVEVFTLSYLLGMVVFALTISFLYGLFRNRYLKYFSAYWWLLIMAYIMFYLALRFNLELLYMPYFWVVYLSLVILNLGIMVYKGEGFNVLFKKLLIGLSIIFLILPVFSFFPLLYITIIFLIFAFLQGYASKMIYTLDGIVHKILGILLFLMALNTLFYPFTYLDPLYVAISLMISGLLGAMLGIFMIILHMVSMQHTATTEKSKLLYMSYHDSMTNLYNRTYFDEWMQRYDNQPIMPMSLILCDLNNLKQINDTYGHFYGDQMIKRVATILLKNTSNKDKVIRFGGDEFVLFLPYKNSHEATRLKMKLFDEVSKEKIHDVQISLALGVSSKTDLNEPMQELFNRAEEVMYQDKTGGIR